MFGRIACSRWIEMSGQIREAAPSQVGELGFPNDASVAIRLALDLVLKHAASFGQWADDNLTV
jgi:hypothetical protein